MSKYIHSEIIFANKCSFFALLKNLITSSCKKWVVMGTPMSRSVVTKAKGALARFDYPMKIMKKLKNSNIISTKCGANISILLASFYHFV
jgi:hypothetical protein